MSSTIVEPVVIVVQLCLALCDPMDCGTPDFPLSPSPGLCSNSCPLRKWCHPTISYSVVPFSSCPQSFPASESFPMSQLFASGDQIIRASASIIPMNSQGWFPLWLTGLISFLSKELSRVLQHYSLKASILWHSAFFMVQLSHSYMTTGKTIALTIQTFAGKVMSLLFNMVFNRFVIAFLPRSKHLLISWIQSPSTVILEPKKINSVTVSIVSPSIWHEVTGLDAMIFVFWMLSFKPAFSLSSFTLIKRLFSSSLLSAIKVVSSELLRLLIFLPAILFQLVLHPAWHVIYSLDILLSRFGTSLLFHVQL